MAKQANHQRVLAGLTTLALVASQVPASAIAEAEPEAGTQVEGEAAPVEENAAEAEDAALAIAAEDGDIMLASDTLALSLHGGAITKTDLYSKLEEKFGHYNVFQISNESFFNSVNYADWYTQSSITLHLSGTYDVKGRVENGTQDTTYVDLGTLQVSRTQKVTFETQGADGQGGVNGAVDGEYPVGTEPHFETKEDVPDYKVDSVTVEGAGFMSITNGRYSLTVGEEDVVVTVAYEPKEASTAFLSVETGNSTAKFLDAEFTAGSLDTKEVPAETTGTLTVAPEDGYAVVGVNYNGIELPLSFSKGVATASLTSPYRDDLGSLKVTTAKCGLVTKGNATEFEVALVGSDPSEYESLIYAAAIDAEGSVPSGLTADDVKIQYDAGVLWGPWEDLDYQLPDGIVGHNFDASEGKTEKIRVTFEGNEQYAEFSVEFTVKSVDDRLYTSLTVEAKDGGTASADKAGAAEGEKVAVTAVPASDDYVFGGWEVISGDAVVADAAAATTTVTMGSENATVVASFIAKTKVTVNAGEGGSAYAAPAKGLKGDAIKLVATASDGYVFSGWEVVSGDIKIADASAAETSFVLGEDAPVFNAVFKKVAAPAPADDSSNKKAAAPAPADDSNNKKQQAEAAKANTPETGDVINAYAPVAAGVAAAAVIAGVVLVRRRNM